MKQPTEIETFLINDLINLLKAIPVDTKPAWGSMNVWQMIEHLAWPFKASNGQLQMPITTPEDKVERVKNIGLMNDKPMQRNFDNPIFTEEYRKMRNTTIEASIDELHRDVLAFISLFKANNSSFTQVHNIFGALNYEEWLQFHYKHAKHHLEQFGVTI